MYKTERFDRELDGRLRGAPFVSGRAAVAMAERAHLFCNFLHGRSGLVGRTSAGAAGIECRRITPLRNAHAWKMSGWPAGAGGLNPRRFARAGRSGGFPARAARGFLDHGGILGTVLRPIRPVRSRAASLADEYCTLPKTAKDTHRIMPDLAARL